MIIEQDIIQEIKRNAFENETNRQLNDTIVEIIYQKEWFKILMPKYLGGGGYTLPEAVQLFETLARIDANVAWVINLVAGANMFAGYFDKKIAQQIFNSREIACAGSGAISGNAVKKGDYYTISGTWKYASGSSLATHFTLNAWLINEDGEPIKDEHDKPIFKSFIVEKDKVILHDTWHTMGLRATSSNDFTVQKVDIHKDYAFDLTRPSLMIEDTLYQFSFESIAVINVTSMISGMAFAFLDEWEELMETKKPLYAQKLLKEEEFVVQTYNKYKNAFIEAHRKASILLEEAWVQIDLAKELSNDVYLTLEIAYHELAQSAYELVFHLYPLFGMTTVYNTNRINKIFRDFMTANQHYQLNPIQLYKKKNLKTRVY